MRNSIPRISYCCQLQERDIPPEQRTFKRVNGLQLPLHPLQVLGWLVLSGITVATFSVRIQLPGPSSREPLLAILIAFLLIHLVSHLIVLLIDPAESKVRAQRHTLKKPEFDRSKHTHIIENGRCHLCNINATGKRTKHCWDCNKCVVDFDHHCKWLNNCIGSRNYVTFIICVVSAIASTLAVLTLSIVELANANANVYFQNTTMDNGTLPVNTPVTGTGSLIVISIVGVLSAIAAVLLIHLCLFHGYIACLGITTYEYMRTKRDKDTTNIIAQSPRISEQCPSFCNSSASPPLRYHFCESVSSIEGSQIDSRNVYICSTHSQGTVNKTAADSTSEKDRKKFHLYFSYETHSNETSIELTSRTTLADHSQNISPLELKPSTPSPVSCCFSIINPSFANIDRQKQKKRQNNDSLQNERAVPRTCTTMRRIQTYLRTKLRKSARQRALNVDTTGGRKNKVTPLTNSESTERDDSVRNISVAVKDELAVEMRPSTRLPPLALSSKNRAKQVNQVHATSTWAISKRNQQHLRVRRASLRKRSRFKMGNHVTQSAQLSPIPESEQSKPTSPHSPPQSNHFMFPPLHT